MHAVAKVGPQDGGLRAIEVPDAVAGPGQVVIRPVGSGICGTDVSIYHWYPGLAARYNPAWPLVLGHEFSGYVEALGPDVSGPAVGDLVTVNPHLTCGTCFYCNQGRNSLCDALRVMGCHVNGGWSERVAVPARNVHPAPPGVDAELTPLSEPLTVAVHAVVEQVRAQPGDTVVVLGAGTIGLMTLLVCQTLGAAHVLVAGLAADAARLRLAADWGGIAVNLDAEALPGAVRRCNPRGADVAFDTTGHAEAIHPALASLRRGGRLGLVGINHGASPLDTLPVVLDEIELIGVRAYARHSWTPSMALLGQLAPRLRPLITHTLPYREADAAIGLIERREAIKVVLQPD